MSQPYYIHNLERERGSQAVWWKPNSHGYTTDLNEAGYYTLEQAKAICAAANLMKVEDIMIPVEEAQALASSSVPRERLHDGYNL